MTYQNNFKTNNGVDIEALERTWADFERIPEAAVFTLRSDCAWIEGTYSTNSLNGFFGLGRENKRKQTFYVESDHPEVFHGADRAPTAPEIVLAALASCLTASVAATAQKSGIPLNAVRAKVEGDIDARGFLGVSGGIRSGFSDIRVWFEIDADGCTEDIKALVKQSQDRSAVFDILTKPTHVNVLVTNSLPE
ncbi:OsmC family protein [Ruegeria sp. WL0004]|uniref:OsmC family protein n=1 Tax=Ruegeria marisflavi TaxID=2984152 RepID=A0ABT2WLK0_9RHOB|nr:OsmC family protein [Ruegeria sp. WL0004]MCU9836543.1 OsmC family protein [Ruegeria sp. WL0004]